MDKTRYLEISGRQLAGPDIQKETAQHRASSTAEKIEQRRRKKVCRTTKETFGAGKKKGEESLTAEGTRESFHRQRAWHIWETGEAEPSQWPVGYEGYVV